MYVNKISYREMERSLEQKKKKIRNVWGKIHL